MRFLLPIAAFLLLAACVSIEMPVSKRPLGQAPEGSREPVPGERTLAGKPADQALPRVDCGTQLTQEEDLRRSVVEQLAENRDYYAALAQVESLPQRAASVALLRAGILRQLDPVESERWYRALLGTCLSGHAEHGLGLLEASRGRYADALVRLRVAARAYPSDPRIRNDLGVIHLYLRDDSRAAFELRTAHELAKDDPQPRFNLMLLALLQADSSGWMSLRERWQPDGATRAELRAACQRVMPVRLGSGTSLAGCPVDPMI